MKRSYLVLLLLMTMSFVSFGQYKVQESSQKNMPGWVHSVERDYLNVSATGSSIDEAKAVVLEKIKEQIAQSIASRIVAESNLSTSAYQSGNDFSKTQTLESSIRSKTAKLPFIGEISLSKASDFYWEKRYYKSSKTYDYFYAVKYPFSDFEMKKLVAEYQAHEAKLNLQIDEFEAGLYNISSIEDIDNKLSAIRAFLPEFDIDDPRYKRVEEISNRYRQLYDHISIDYFQEKKGIIVVNLSLSGREITTSQRPTLKSNCASKITSSYEGSSLVIRYDDFNCYDEDENYIDIKFRTGNKQLTERIFFKSTVRIALTGVVSDATTGEPVPYAKITLIPGGKTATTGRNGVYVYNDIPAGYYSVQAMKKGYYTVEASADISSSYTARTDIKMNPDPNAKETLPTPGASSAAAAVPAVAQQPAASSADPLNTVLNGLSAYFRFNGSTRSEISAIQGNPINSPKFVSAAKDGSQAICFSSLDESQIILPKAIISTPLKSYSVTFWIKGISDGHVWSCTDGVHNWFRSNLPQLVIKNGKFVLKENSNIEFSHQTLDYNWHFVAVVVDDRGYQDCTAYLFIDGVLIDSGNLGSSSRDANVVKFLLGGKDGRGENGAIDTNIDNLRIYSSRALSEREVAQIYMSEK